MNSIWYGIGHFMQKTLDLFIASAGWAPIIIFSFVIAIGLGYWMYCQVRYTKRDQEKGTLI